MYCRSCGSQIADDSKFCSKCGIRIESEFIKEAVPPIENKGTVKTWPIIVVILALLALILPFSAFLTSVGWGILGVIFFYAKDAFQEKNWPKLVAVIVVGCIGFAIVAGIRGSVQTEKKNRYKTSKYSYNISKDKKITANEIII